ncbi:MAG: pyridoxamine 5'-phosphate oxidase family protein [Chitinophagaceae bacterium]|nr:pyridoxamine 5'-phosphate oxidase family protein [Chitinophagaceae bacterium]
MLGVLDDKQIDALLHSQVTGRIGCHADNRTYVVPVTYVYDGENIICHTREGLKLEMMRKNPEVCFEVDYMENMANWQSVIVWGIFEELSGLPAKEAMEKLIDRVSPFMTSETIHAFEPGESPERRDTKGFTAIVYQIKITEKTGRFEKR